MDERVSGRRRNFMEAFGQYSPGQQIVPYVGSGVQGPEVPESDEYFL